MKSLEADPLLFMCKNVITILFLTCFCTLSAQKYFPIKVNKKWGLIDAEGNIELEPVYDAIGEFKQFGFAVMQRNGLVGLLNQSGREVVPPKFEDLKVLNRELVAVMDQGQWMVIDLNGNIILQKGYEQLEVWEDKYLAYRSQNKWGIVQKDGRQITAAQFDEIQLEDSRYFYTKNGDSWGLLNLQGQELIPAIAEEIKIFNDSLYFYKEGHHWGAIGLDGAGLLPPQYDYFSKISDHFIKLYANNKLYVYSINSRKVIGKGEHDDYYPFSKNYIISKKNRKLGLINWQGEVVLLTLYNEIQAYERNQFRVNFEGKWGVVGANQEVVIPIEYDYIAPLREKVCMVKQDDLFGVVNFKGEEIVPPKFHRIELDGKTGRAYFKKAGGFSEESLTLLNFDDEGQLVENNNFAKHYRIRIGGKAKSTDSSTDPLFDEDAYSLDRFEWFYSPQEDRWGLRRLDDGGIQIEPTFHYVKVERELGFSLVGIENNGRYEFERTTYSFDMIFGLVNNEVGLLVTEVDFWDVRFDDFRAGNPVARVVFSNGRHGLVDRIGKITRRDFAYIGDFLDGVARMSIRGRLSGSIKRVRGLQKLNSYLSGLLSPNSRKDYTSYDRIFQTDAMLICEDCEWGFIDTSSAIVVPPTYSFARDFVNDVGIVECEGKWGMVNKKAEILIPCQYDGVQFLENTENKIIKVYLQRPKYGLIDTLGQLTVSAIYEEIGSFSEGRLAVRKNGLWGFVNRDGLEVIPCRFKEVSNFSLGLAAVKLGRNWGFIDKQGEIEIDFKYKNAGNFKFGLAWVQTSEGVGYINKKEEFVIPVLFDKAFDFEMGVARIAQSEKFGLIDTNGKFVQRPKFSAINAFDQHGLAIVTYGGNRVRYGIIDLKGAFVTNTGFLKIQPFREGFAVVKQKNGYGYIDTLGNLVIPTQFSKASSFSEGLAAVHQNGACGYIRKTGQKAVPFEFSRCLDFDEGKAVVYKGLKKAGLVDKEGDYILEPSVNRLLKFKGGRGLVRDEEYRFYFITEQAGLYNGFYQRATAFKHGVAVVQIAGKWGIINQRGIEVIPPKYDKIESFQNGYAKVRIKGFNGLSNLKGELIVDPDYEYISYAGDGLFRVEQGDKIGYFDMAGKWVWGLSK